ncbi:MAG: hypothetical protein KDC26_12760 [Armatimonadetes bacterium]|nr:hypothetical protein [Armatimonadota bacterium]
MKRKTKLLILASVSLVAIYPVTWFIRHHIIDAGFLEAISVEDLDTSQKWLSWGANINFTCPSCGNALDTAIAKKDPHIIQWLLDHGAKPTDEQARKLKILLNETQP